MDVIGRQHEKKIFDKCLESDDSQFVAVYGRRRVGKTYLIRNYFEKQLSFHFTGLNDSDTPTQLAQFSLDLQHYAKSSYKVAPQTSWLMAFDTLRKHLEKLSSKKKKVIFLDELPWIATPRSGFLPALENFWNTWASTRNDIILVACGSAASWMLKHIVNNKGGLHNRINKKVRLLPFTLSETEEYLKWKNIKLSRIQICQLYMALGGVPFYLKEISHGKSAMQIIDDLCFAKDGLLVDEYNKLYESLFADSQYHKAIINLLSTKKKGLTRKQVLDGTAFTSGGGFNRIMDELVESGFVAKSLPYGKKTKDAMYYLIDPFSIFYSKFMKNARTGKEAWLSNFSSQSYVSWSGFAFERVVMTHIKQVKIALQIAGIYTEESSWLGEYASQKAQIDILIDRADNTITLCEAKFYKQEYVFTAKTAKEIQQRQTIFEQSTRTKKNITQCLVTTHGLTHNAHSLGLVQHVVVLDDLFR